VTPPELAPLPGPEEVLAGFGEPGPVFAKRSEVVDELDTRGA